ncbi:hypothetical protein PVAND_000610 [Polypedilum vanderplanki]|uniref:Uncharacterized protein n=1 Tax=Polypedilum vanderplanki TaxID=319348 RepID=A0A9J6BKU0_POLVA|nr:hypothetical protein PVAND_000610 [Polypedilum vanderplanki]
MAHLAILLSLARSDSTGSTTSMQQHGNVPELLIGLGRTFSIERCHLNDFSICEEKYEKKRNVGWFSLGLNSSGPEEAQHFNDMRDAANVNGQVAEIFTRRHSISHFMKRLSRDGALALSGKKHEDSCTVDVDICDQLPGDDLNFV